MDARVAAVGRQGGNVTAAPNMARVDFGSVAHPAVLAGTLQMLAGSRGDEPAEQVGTPLWLTEAGHIVVDGRPSVRLPAPTAGNGPVTVPDDEVVPLSAYTGETEGPSFLVEGPVTIPYDICMLYGDGGVGKSWLAYQLAVCVATGTGFLGGHVKQGPVLILDFENQDREMAARVKRAARALGIDPDSLDDCLHVKPYARGGQTLPALEDRVVSLVERIQPSLVIVDGWQTAFGGSPVDAENVTNGYRILRRIGGGTRAVVYLHHVSTTSISKDGDNPTASGNRFMSHFARVQYLLGKDKGGTQLLQVKKENYGISQKQVTLRRVSGENVLTFTPTSGLDADLSKTATTRPEGRSKGQKRAPRDVRRREAEPTLVEFLSASGSTCLVSELVSHAATKWGCDPKTARSTLVPTIDRLSGTLLQVEPDDKTRSQRLTLIPR